MSNSLPRQEKKFFDALNDIFVGAKIEGKGGYINLMNIKNKYYKEHIYGEIIRFIEKRFNANNSNREELFARLYTFFNRYFNETGSIYFQYTPLKENIYERVYSNKEDVSLFYKTHMLYYVKSERIFNSVDLKIEDNDLIQDFHFNFDVSNLELAKNNEKKEIVFSFEKVEKKKVFLKVSYSAKGNKTKIDDILKNIKKEDSNLQINEETLSKALTTYKKQSEVDYFINKDAKKFLKEQFNLWYYSYLFGDSRNGEFEISDFDDRRIRELQGTKEIAYKIIDFISQFEDELVKVWNKPKFVRNSNYVLTLDKLENNIDLIEKILSHKDFEKQEQEWKNLGYKLDNYKKSEIIKDGILNEEFKFLTIDTKYFEDIKYDILDVFEDLDNELNGVLINSDNYQALNTLQHKYKGKVKCIYIDPPYNTGSDGFIYKDGIKHGTWLTMMENRLKLAKEFLTDDGVIFASIDDREQANLKLLLDNVFGEENFLSGGICINNMSGRSDDKYLATAHEHVYIYSKQKDKCKFYHLKREDFSKYKHKDNISKYSIEGSPLRKTGKNSKRTDRPNLFYPIYVSSDYTKLSLEQEDNSWIKLLPIDGKGIERTWTWEKKTFLKDKDSEIHIKYDEEGIVSLFKKGRLKETEKPKSILYKKNYSTTTGTKILSELFPETDFTSPKSIFYIKDLLTIGASKNDVILDFFSGSGTTQHSVIELNREDGGNRKYIGVEMGEHFDNVIKPRIKKVVNSKKWKEGKGLDSEGTSHFMKYSGMEQYEESLEKIKYSEDTIFTQMNEENKDIFSNYVFLKDEKLTKAIELDLENGKTKIDLTKIYDDIDIGETLSNITGRKIKKIRKDSVILDGMDEIKFDNIPLELVKPLIWWK